MNEIDTLHMWYLAGEKFLQFDPSDEKHVKMRDMFINEIYLLEVLTVGMLSDLKTAELMLQHYAEIIFDDEGIHTTSDMIFHRVLRKGNGLSDIASAAFAGLKLQSVMTPGNYIV